MSTIVIRLAGGQDVVSAITKDSALVFELAEGDSVKAVIKATEVMYGRNRNASAQRGPSTRPCCAAE
jgi:molybdate transport system regulatory protein